MTCKASYCRGQPQLMVDDFCHLTERQIEGLMLHMRCRYCTQHQQCYATPASDQRLISAELCTIGRALDAMATQLHEHAWHVTIKMSVCCVAAMPNRTLLCMPVPKVMCASQNLSIGTLAICPVKFWPTAAAEQHGADQSSCAKLLDRTRLFSQSGLVAVIRLNLTTPFLKPLDMSGMTSAPCNKEGNFEVAG